MFIPPKSDIGMKELFYNATVRKYFISDMLDIPATQIRSVRLRNTFLRRLRHQKQGILDVCIELNDESKINIEIQVRIYKYWDRRQLFYLAKMYTEDLMVGEDYSRLKRCVAISLLDFNLTDRPQYHSVYRLRDPEGHEFSDMLEVHIVELRKKLAGENPVNEWIRLFNVESMEELDMIRTNNPGIKEAIRELRTMSLGRALRYEYEPYLKAKSKDGGLRRPGVGYS